MGRMSDLMISLQEEIELGLLSFDAIADKYEVPRSWVDEAAAELDTQYKAAEGQPDELQEWHDYDPDC